MTDKRIGVFICHCGGNISDYVDVEQVRETLAQDPSVKVAQTNIFTCSDAGQQNIITAIQEENLDGIVVASCSPKLHLNTFRAAAQRAGLNQYKYTQVNIREQCSWAHTHDQQSATEKAISLIRAGVARTILSIPLEKLRVETIPHALVVGAGVAGLRAALALSDMGISVHLVERANELGGLVGRWGKMFPNDKTGAEMIEALVAEVRNRDNVVLFTNAELVEKGGHVGDFSVRIAVANGDTVSLKVGSIIVATGFDPYIPDEGKFGFGIDGVVTLPEYKELLSSSSEGLRYKGRDIKTVTYVYCVGSRENTGEEGAHTYCSRYCCSAASHAAICTHELDAGIHQFHLFRDIRTYGKYELLNEKALKQGAVFIRFEEDEPPQISDENGQIVVRVKDRLSGGEEVKIPSDLVVLVTGMVPRENERLLDVLKLPVGKDGFLNEIHPKLRPVETVIDGVFIAGAAQGPKTLGESVASGLAAVSKTSSLLLKGYVDLEPQVAKVDANACEWCGACAEACIYGAIERMTVDGKEIAKVNAILCKGGGACVPVCPRQAVAVEGYTNEQVNAMIDALVAEVV